MSKLDAMIADCERLREFHSAQRRKGVNGAGIEACAVAIRERALLEARQAILSERGVSCP